MQDAYTYNLGKWAAFLNSSAGWTASLNAAFDSIGFTEEYIARVAGNASHPGRYKSVKDNVWGMIDLDPVACWILDSPILQRLRFIRQLGFSYLTYPSAQHSRFEHTVGVYHVVGRLLDAFKRTAELDQQRKDFETLRVAASAYDENNPAYQLIRMAALLHDIGHTVFSHVSENYFQQAKEETNIGPFSIAQFEADALAYLRGMKAGGYKIKSARKKNLSELVSVGIVVSERFRKFLKACPHFTVKGSIENVTAQIGSLILGDPIVENDRALPMILSGPFDADKIDYMLRDAQACGILLSLDVSRLFFRAGIYEVRATGMLPQDFDTDTLPIKVFILDQSGTDAIREMAAARASLYARVYHHQLTLNAERHFWAVLAAARADTGHTELNPARDLLKLWPLSDEVSLSLFAGVGSTSQRRLATNLLSRNLLKRASCLSVEIADYQARLPETLQQFENALRSTAQRRAEEIRSSLNLPEDRARIKSLIIAECERIRDHLVANGHDAIPTTVLDDDSVRLVASPNDEGLKRALILLPDRRIVQQDSKLPSYFDAARVTARRAFLLVPSDWREIALVAFQRVLYELNPSDDTISLEMPLSEADEAKLAPTQADYLTRQVLALQVHYRPCIDAAVSATESRVDWSIVERILLQIDSQGFESLFPVTPPPSVDIAKFKGFEGEQGWRVSSGVLAAFLKQFPPLLRDDAEQLLDRIKVLDRKSTVDLLMRAIDSFEDRGKRKFRVAALSPSSGTLLRTLLRDRVLQDSTVSLYATVQEALAEFEAGDRLLLIDDNIASGSQASKQLRIWAGLESDVKASSNYFRTRLSVTDWERLKRSSLSFAFGLGRGGGQLHGHPALETTLRNLDLETPPTSIRFSEDFTQYSGREGSVNPISADLRNFLRTVGTGLMREQLLQEGAAKEEEISAEAGLKALGYNNEEALYVTGFNVPSATYTALWCPGYYENPRFQRVPWQPLFIRTGKLRNLVLF